MTAQLQPDWRVASDEQLVSATLRGDRQALGVIYDRYADALHDFCVGMLRDSEGAADCVHDVFCAAATQLHRLHDRSKLRPWLYAIARRNALGAIGARRREQPFEAMPEAASTDADPETVAARTELADLIADAAGGLSDRDRAVLDLAYRHGLDGPELAEALDVTPGTANRIVSRLRATVETSLGALLIARNGRDAGTGCAELRALLDGWDGDFTVLVRKRVARHLDACPTCDTERRRLVSPAALLGAAAVFVPAPHWLRHHTLSDIRLTAAESKRGLQGVGVHDDGPTFSYEMTGKTSGATIAQWQRAHTEHRHRNAGGVPRWWVLGEMVL